MSTTTMAQESAKPKTFDDLPLSGELRRALRDMDYQTPTPVQLAVFESASAGRDLVVQARTGTGKTTAFGLPIVDRLVSGDERKVQAMILCPTRELALQVSRELARLSAHKKVSITAIYGGAPIGRQIDQLEAGTQVIVGTPGRVLDHLRRRTLDPSGIRALVLDESDEMLSMGFERELTAIIDHLPRERQTLLFSATVPPDIERMAKSKLDDPEFVILSGDHVGALEINHYVYNVSGDKLAALAQIIEIEDPESAIIFCNTREQTSHVSNYLRREGFESAWLNGDLQQSERENVMRRTREGKLRFLVATDVAARGIDISHLTHVINFDFPQDAESYVHRTGRTGRAGRTGTAISLVAPREIGSLYILRLTYKIRPIERQLPNERDAQTRLEADIVQGLVDTFAGRAHRSEHRALAQRLLTHDDAEAAIAGMLAEHLSANPELPELAQSRRRAKAPPPVDEMDESAESDEDRKHKRRKKGDEDDKKGKKKSKKSKDEKDKKRDKHHDDDDDKGDKGDKKRKRDKHHDDDKGDKKRKHEEREIAQATVDAPATVVVDRELEKRSAVTLPAAPKAVAAKREASPVAPAPVAAPADRPLTLAEARALREARARGEVPAAPAPTTSDEGAEGGDPERPRRKRRRRRASSGEAKEQAGQGASEMKPTKPAAKPSEEAPKPAKSVAKAPAAPAESPDEGATRTGPTDELRPGVAELRLDLDRKAGSKVRRIKSILADAGVMPEQVHRLRLRDDGCYVEVEESIAEVALEALQGVDLGDGHALTAERSR